jgi:carbonic anhydrase
MPFDLPFRPAPQTRPAILSIRHSAWTVLAFALAGAWVQPSDAAESEHRSPRASAENPMDTLRQKLAERLGAQKPDSRGANVMRVDNRNAGVTPVAPVPAALPRTTTVATAAPAPSPASRHVEAPQHPPGDGHWDYAGEAGPDAWGRLKPEFAKCSSGERQSPIDIRGGIAVQLEPIQFDYRTTGFSVIDNGHTVQVNLPAGNAITVLGRRFELLQFHFHRPSEERINGRQYDMVAHLVHKDAEGKLAVVAVLLDRGAAQPVIQAVWNALPLEKNEAQAAPGTIDLNKLLPEDRRYYTYMGSLTTPPCSEGVLWMVMKTPVPVSPEQVDIFAHLYPMNARPVQRVAGRLIKESN